ncbi:hypothetical protein LCGC14_1300980 [marine sediment metagenome]|uniref:Uncharacterized protein n=1 Tax=marine sediment metagenome TaxID=412755 RepID=A0A0F9N6A9_9ZZZZ
MFIYVILDVYRPESKYDKRELFEEKVTKGPYTKLYRGYQGDIMGLTPEGEVEKVFEATVGRGGYCDSCAYEYPDFGIHMPAPIYDAEVKHFEIVVREE